MLRLQVTLNLEAPVIFHHFRVQKKIKVKLSEPPLGVER